MTLIRAALQEVHFPIGLSKQECNQELNAVYISCSPKVNSFGVMGRCFGHCALWSRFCRVCTLLQLKEVTASYSSQHPRAI